MKIAIFTDVFLEVPGGIPSSINAQRKYLKKDGIDSVVFCPATKGWPLEPGVEGVPTFRFLKPGGAPFAKRIKKVKKAILKNHPDFGKEFDLVHVHYEGACSLAGMQLAREFQLPLVQTMHGREDAAAEANIPHPVKTLGGNLISWLHSFGVPHTVKVKKDDYLAPTKVRAALWSLMVNHANFADAVITPSHHFKQKLQHYGVKKPFYVISNAIPDDELPKKQPLRDFDGKGPLRLMWNSRVSNEKRILPFLEAIKLSGVNLKMEVYGDGNALKKAKNYVFENDLENKVKFFGRVSHDQMLEKMKDKHLSVMVSNGFDNQSMTILEARAVGLPMFYCDPDMDEVVAKSGAVKSGPSPAEMAEALEKVVKNPASIKKMSSACLTTRSEIMESTVIKQLEKLYKSLVS